MEKSILLEFIGDTPLTRIIDFLIDNKGIDYTKKDVAGSINISRTSLFKYWGKLEEFGLVRVTRKFGKTKLYTLNEDNELVKKLLEIELVLIKNAMKEEVAKQKVPVSA